MPYIYALNRELLNNPNHWPASIQGESYQAVNHANCYTTPSRLFPKSEWLANFRRHKSLADCQTNDPPEPGRIYKLRRRP